MRTRARSWQSGLAGVIGVGVFLTLGAVVAAWATDSPSGHSHESSATVISHLRNRYEAVSGARPFNSLDDLLDNVRYSGPGRETRPMTEAVVVGEVTDVSRGMGFYVEGNDGPTGIETDFDDARVLWRTVHLTVDVEETLSGATQDPVTVGFAFGSAITFEQIQRDFLSYGSVLLFMQRGQPVFDYDENVYGTVMDGALLGLVDSDGSFSLPLLEDMEAAALMKRTESVDALARAREAKPREIELDESGVVVGGDLD